MIPWWEDHEAQVTERTTPYGPMRRLSVWRRDGKEGISWDTLQEIKNDLLGPEIEAVEVYPAQVRVVNEAAMRHLWEWPAGMRPLGIFPDGRGLVLVRHRDGSLSIPRVRP